MSEYTVPVEGKQYDVEVYRTRAHNQIKVERGARIATVTEPFNVGRKARNELEADLRVAVASAWTTHFGKLDWTKVMVQVFVVHMPHSVTVEMAVTEGG